MLQEQCSLFKKLQLRASHAIPNHYFSLLLDLLARRVVNPQALVTHTFPLAEAETVFQVAVNPEEEALKVVITPSR